MKEKKDKTNGLIPEFQRYVRGEMTKRQENSFQRKLQRDPFAAEAADGYSEITTDEADEDLDRLGKRLKKRTAGKSRKIFYRIAASIAVLMIISSVYLFIQREKPVSKLSKSVVTPAKKEVTDSKQAAGPILQVAENEVASTEVSGEQEKVDEISTEAISAVTDNAPVSDMAMAEKQDSVVLIAEDQISMADKKDTAVLITADMAAKPVAAQSEAVLAEYRAETKNARAAGAEAIHTPPQPATGKESYDRYIIENVRRPASLAAGDSAVVVVSFTVNITGAIDGFKVISSPGDEFSNEARRIVIEGPAWKPAVTNGEKTDEEVRLTITIK